MAGIPSIYRLSSPAAGVPRLFRSEGGATITVPPVVVGGKTVDDVLSVDAITNWDTLAEGGVPVTPPADRYGLIDSVPNVDAVPNWDAL